MFRGFALFVYAHSLLCQKGKRKRAKYAAKKTVKTPAAALRERMEKERAEIHSGFVAFANSLVKEIKKITGPNNKNFSVKIPKNRSLSKDTVVVQITDPKNNLSLDIFLSSRYRTISIYENKPNKRLLSQRIVPQRSGSNRQYSVLRFYEGPVLRTVAKKIVGKAA